MVIFFVCTLAIRYAGVALDIPRYISDEFVSFLLFFAVYVGTRLFRGRGEPIEPSRPWWRMSALPTASFVLAVVFAIRSVFSVWAVVSYLAYGSFDANFVLSCSVDPLLFAGYLNSGIRLARVKVSEGSAAETADSVEQGFALNRAGGF